MTKEKVQKSFGQSSFKKKHNPIVPPLVDYPTQATSQSSSKVKPSKKIPSLEERDAIRRSLFEKWGNATPSSIVYVRTHIQAKLTIGAPGDKYEQEADQVASQVVNQIHALATAQSTQGESVQRQDEKKEELQKKLEITALQRQEEQKDEIQTKSIHQRREAITGGRVREQIIQRAKLKDNNQSILPPQITPIVDKWAQKNKLSVSETKKLRTKIVKETLNSTEEYETQEKFEEGLIKRCNELYKKQTKGQQVNESGKALEEDAAKILRGGAIGDPSAQDVQWRAILRSDLDKLKKEFEVSDDYEFFKTYKKLKSKNPERFAFTENLTSTPVDVYGPGFLALAGGASKFEQPNEDGNFVLKANTEARIKELIVICKAIDYTPLVIFNQKTTEPKMLRAVQDKFKSAIDNTATL
ncbi:MAG: hypothetical protein PUP91_38605 [Rhizonema sp. PD37]|nr:hypothetical protein [Rhizonema sp. PD37]